MARRGKRDHSTLDSPAVGAMEAISAIEMLTRLKKTTTMMYRYIRPAVPPFPRPKTMVLEGLQSA
jgi:hypothetical protein